MLPIIEPRDAYRRVQAGEAVLIDIREAGEFAREHIPGAKLAPLSRIANASVDLGAAKSAIFYCRSGNRTTVNAGALLALGLPDSLMLDGGIEEWRDAGLPLQLDRRQPIDLMRQVQIASGGMVVAGVLLAWLASPWFVLLSAFAGSGLMFAGMTGFCGMAKLLAAMPWNRRAAA